MPISRPAPIARALDALGVAQLTPDDGMALFEEELTLKGSHTPTFIHSETDTPVYGLPLSTYAHKTGFPGKAQIIGGQTIFETELSREADHKLEA